MGCCLGKNQIVIKEEKVSKKLGAYNFDLDNLYDDVINYLSTAKENEDLSEGITGAIYFEGDFTKSIEYVEKLVDSLETNRYQYNLYNNNCLQVSMDVLAEGTFDKYDNKYKEALLNARKNPFPNSAYNSMLEFEAMIDEYMNTVERVFSFSPHVSLPIYTIERY